MAQRTVSIVIEVDGAEGAIRQMRQMRTALDDLGGGTEGLAQVLRQSREVAQAMQEMQNTFSLRGQQRQIFGDLDEWFRRILTGARSTRDVFKILWQEAGNFLRQGASALASLTVGSTNRAISALGGLGSGALTGFSVGGPIGAALGGLIGGIAGLFSGGSGKAKQHDAAIANQGFAQLAHILDDYNHFRRDYASAIDAANRIWSQMQSQWTRPQSAPSQRPYFDAILRSLGSTEDERNRRRQLLSTFPVPEFQGGGFVGNRGSGLGTRGMLAVVHPGEFVMNRQAVDRLGVSLLEGWNAGAASGHSAGVSISLEPASAQTLGEMLKRNPQALEEGLLVVLKRGGAASRALRG
jgi:hypothetical protein